MKRRKKGGEDGEGEGEGGRQSERRGWWWGRQTGEKASK